MYLAAGTCGFAVAMISSSSVWSLERALLIFVTVGALNVGRWIGEDAS